MVIYHLLTGMILQVEPCKEGPTLKETFLNVQF